MVLHIGPTDNHRRTLASVLCGWKTERRSESTQQRREKDRTPAEALDALRAHLARKVSPSSEVETKKRRNLTGKTRRKRARSAELSLTPEGHLDEKERSAETIEREQREQLATFESMLRKTKVNLRYAMMRRSKKILPYEPPM